MVGMIGLNKTAEVLVPNAGDGGRFTTVANAALKVRMIHVRGGQTSRERADLASLRHVHFDPTYTMPNPARLRVDGVTWNVDASTVGTLTGPGRGLPGKYAVCDVVKAS